MNTCQEYQAQLLDHLFGLLDGLEREALEVHLEACDACRSARATAEQQRQVIAFAAKGAFPEVRFDPPAVKVAAHREEAPQVLPVHPRRWGRWAVAAGLLLAAGLGLVGGLSYSRHSDDVARAREDYDRTVRARDALARNQQRDRARDQQDIAEIQEQIRLLEAKWDGEVKKVQREFNDRDVQIVVTGPKTVQAGAPNVYRIEAHRQHNNKALGRGLKMTARILDATSKRELARHPVTEGATKWVLPQNLPVKPGAQLTLVVTEENEGTPITWARAIAATATPLGMNPYAAVLSYAARESDRTRVSEGLQLVGALFVTHLTTDRPMYRPGEVVRFRSLTLERFRLKPGAEDFQLRYRITDPRGGEVFKLDGAARVTVEGPKGKTEVLGPDGKAVRGIGAGEFRVPSDAAGGEYTLTVSEAFDRFPPERRKFLVNQYQAPRLNKELEFTRKSYGPGDVVEANCKVARVEGGAVIDNQPVTVSALVDGQACTVLDEGVLRVRQGAVTVRFRLPEKMERGSGIASVQFQDGGTHETLVRPIPIVLKKLFVEFFPEGGDLAAGVPNRVYFTAKTTLGKPAELRGRLVDQDGTKVAEVRTLNDDTEAGVNQGMGLFEFTPQAGKTYEVKIDAPIGIESRHTLPAAKVGAVALSIPNGVFTEKIDVVLRSADTTRKLLVGAYCRGRLLDHLSVVAKKGEAVPVALTPAASVSGVYRVTVFEDRGGAELVPVAERLVYRRPVEQLRLEVKADKDAYSPGDRVTLSFKAVDEQKRPVPAIIMAAAVDQGIIKLADEKTARSMPTHFYLTTEVRQPEELEYADFLVGTNAKAARALDLLLGTQGWRRFAEQKDPGRFREQQKQDADRLLMASGAARPEQNNLHEVRVARLDRSFAPRHLTLQQKLAAKEAQEEQRQGKSANELAQLQGRIHGAQVAATGAEMELREQKDRLLKYALMFLAAVLLVAGVAGFAVGMMRIANERPGATPYFATGVSALLLLVILGLGSAVAYLGDRPHAFGPVAANMKPGGAGAMAPKMGRGEVRLDEMAEGMDGVKGMKDAAPPPMAMDDGKLNEKEKAPPPMARMPAEPAKGPRPVDFAAPAPEVHAALGLKPPPAPLGAINPDAPGGILNQAGQGLGGLGDRPGRPQGFGGGKQMAGGGFGLQPGEPRMPMKMPPMGMAPPGVRGGDDGLKAEMPMGGANFRQAGLEPMNGEQAMLGWERDLRKNGKFKEIAQLRMRLEPRRANALPAAVEPLIVREYAHKHTPAIDNVRRDFAETVYWQPVLVLPGGKKTDVSFDLSDSVTRFQVLVCGHTLDGRLGAVTTEVASRLPFSVEPRVPIEVTRSDKVIIPVAVANDSSKSRSVEIDVQTKNLTVVGPAKKQLALDAGKRVRQLFTFEPSAVEGEATVNFTGRCEPFGVDRVERKFRIVPEGFPVVGSKSDLLENVATHEVVLPETWVKGTLKMQAQVFPSTLADLQKGLESMLREPGGCFEQTSSSNYPNVMILSYMKESDQADPQLEKRARQLLTSGYQMLTSFECMNPAQQSDRRGYEWFGQTAPPHEALTAYGLLQFRDMAKVHPVDAAMVERTKKYLLAQRDGKGGFRRNPRALDSFGRAPDHITTAYIVWALTESGGEDNLDIEMNALLARAKTSKDPYFVALVGIGHLNRGKTAEGLALLKDLRSAQQADGRLTGAQMSITGSGGRDLEIETTALATLAWLRANRPADFNPSVQKAVKWIGRQRGGYGGFGSTQSTILALKALIAFTHDNRKVPADSELILEVNGKRVAAKKFAAGSRDGITVAIPDESILKPGKNQVRIAMEKNQFPYTLTWEYRTRKPANPEGCPVHLTTRLDRAEAEEGETVRLTALVENKSGKGQGMAVAILGLPGGLAVPEDMRQLKDMARLRDDGTKRGEIDAFEIRGRELVLYWRDLAPGKKIEVSVDLVCRIPGEYRGPASRAYLYYNADNKFWTEALTVTIAPKAE